VLGMSWLAPYSLRTVRWTSATATEPLSFMGLHMISADGAAGAGIGGGYRWNSTAGALILDTNESIELGFPNPSNQTMPNSMATAINPDGSIIFGQGHIDGTEWDDPLTAQAYVWQRDVGTRSLLELLDDSCTALDSPLPNALWQIVGNSDDSRLLVACAVIAPDELTDPPDSQPRGQCLLAAWE